jgi:prepilin-type N-terminal cleavage/methylation domain-containing protein
MRSSRYGRVGGGAERAGLPEGFTLVELLVVVLLTAVVVQGGWVVFGTFRKAARKAGEGAQGLETVRTAGWILEEEFSGSVPLRDWWSGGGDSVSLRAFRGLAFVEAPEPAGGVRVCYRGIRIPNVEKDSVLLLGGNGRWTAHALVGRTKGTPGCGGMEMTWTEIWQLEPEWSGQVFARIFERGSYHFSGGALRYRRGWGGRQPLTPMRVGEGTFSSAPGTPEGLHWSLRESRPAGGLDTVPWLGTVR